MRVFLPYTIFAKLNPWSTNVKFNLSLIAVALSLAFQTTANATPSLIATGSLSGTTDLSGLTNTLENGVDKQNVLGGIGSGLAWAGGNTFLALPDRGPNATVWNSAVDNTTSYISRFQTLTLGLNQTNNAGSYSYNLTPTLTGTTLLYSPTALNYGAVTPSINTANQYYFDGRSDNFLAGTNSANTNNARFDPEALRVSTALMFTSLTVQQVSALTRIAYLQHLPQTILPAQAQQKLAAIR